MKTCENVSTKLSDDEIKLYSLKTIKSYRAFERRQNTENITMLWTHHEEESKHMLNWQKGEKFSPYVLLENFDGNTQYTNLREERDERKRMWRKKYIWIWFDFQFLVK